MIIDLSGKSAVVCGSTQGIGKAIALQFAASGANVTIIERNEEALREVLIEMNSYSRGKVIQPSKIQNHNFMVDDLSQTEILKEKIKNFTAENPPVHILVNNTGGPKGGEIFK